MRIAISAARRGILPRRANQEKDSQHRKAKAAKVATQNSPKGQAKAEKVKATVTKDLLQMDKAISRKVHVTTVAKQGTTREIADQDDTALEFRR